MSKKSEILRRRMPSAPPGRARYPKKSFDRVLERAMEVIGNQEEALRWLGTPVRALNCATPISLLRDVHGQNAVLAVLSRLVHCVLLPLLFDLLAKACLPTPLLLRSLHV